MADLSFAQMSPSVTGAGYGLSAFASLAQGILAAQRERRIAAYNADVLTANSQAAAQAADLEAAQQERAAAMAEQDLLLAEQAGTYREARMREQHAAILGQTRAIIAASGLMMSGSPLRVVEETARQQELDILVSQYQTKLQRRALQEEAVQQRYGAALSRYGAQERLRIGAGQAALTRATADTSGVLAGLTAAGGSLLQGTAATLSQREALKTTGPTVRNYAYTRATTPAQPYIFGR